jgi:hypothetical protein
MKEIGGATAIPGPLRGIDQAEGETRDDGGSMPGLDLTVIKGNGVMPSHSRNISEQEHSIKQRSHALFVEPVQPAQIARPTKPFPVYLRETPAQPFSPLTKAIFWLLGIVVASLFLAALWRMSHRRRPNVKTRGPAQTVAMVRHWDRFQCPPNS